MSFARFLIVEDNQPNLDLMAYLLCAFGYEVATSVDGAGALETVEQQTFDLIVSDVQLPDIEGYELVKRLKDVEALKGVPVVAVSAMAMVGDRERIMAAGFDGYIAKPIVPEKFVAELEVFLPKEQHATQRPAAAAARDIGVSKRLEYKATILIVDDQRENQEVLLSLLEPSGYDVLVASTGEQGYRIMCERQPDLVLSDLHLVQEPDFEFIQRVKAVVQWQRIPFLMISSTTDQVELRNQGLNCGAIRFLFGPVEPSTLLAEIEDCLNARE